MNRIKLPQGKPRIVNVGVESFARDLFKQRVPVCQVNWRPPLDIDPASRSIVSKNRDRMTAANQKALEIIQAAKPVLTGMGLARDLIPGMEEDLILHAGPPIGWDRMCGPMRGAVIGALIYEGRARDFTEAEQLAVSGAVSFAPCHEHNAVGPMAGIISASMPVFRITNEAFGNHAFATQNEGLGKVLRYGAYSEEVIQRLKWMDAVLYPVLKRAIASLGGIDLQGIIAQALHMGDEVHNRNRAGTSLLIRKLAPA